MKIGITGATGFFGRHLLKMLAAQGHQVVGWTRHVGSVSGQLKEAADVQWSQGELGDPQATEAFVSRCDAIVHAGLWRSGDGFMSEEADPIAYFQTNVVGSLQLIEAAAKHRLQRFVFVSSGAVHQQVADDRPLDERHPLWPGSLYGAYKASVETVVHAYGFSGKLCACSLRPTAIYGVDDPADQSRYYDLVHQVVAGEDVSPTGGGKVVHVTDVARAAALLLSQDDSVAGQTYNCTDRMVSEHEVAMMAKQMAQSPSVVGGKPKAAGNPMSTTKIESLGMRFGGTSLLEQTVETLVHRMA